MAVSQALNYGNFSLMQKCVFYSMGQREDNMHDFALTGWDVVPKKSPKLNKHSAVYQQYNYGKISLIKNFVI